MIIKVIFWGIPVFLGKLESHTESGTIQVILSVRLVPPCFLAKTTSFMRSSDHNHFFPLNHKLCWLRLMCLPVYCISPSSWLAQPTIFLG